MAFRKINEGEVQSDAGFKIRIGFSRLTYFEEGAAIRLDAEHMADGTLVVYGFQSAALAGTDERRRVMTNVREALTFLGVKFEIEERA
jgi:hypothetical protein